MVGSVCHGTVYEKNCPTIKSPGRFWSEMVRPPDVQISADGSRIKVVLIKTDQHTFNSPKIWPTIKSMVSPQTGGPKDPCHATFI